MNVPSVPLPKHLWKSEQRDVQAIPSPYGPIPDRGSRRDTPLAELFCDSSEHRHEIIAQTDRELAPYLPL